MNFEEAVIRLTGAGLIVAADAEGSSLVAARPASSSGTVFPGFEPVAMGIGSERVETDAPTGTLRRRGCLFAWEVDISIPAAPGPGPVFFRGRFVRLEKAIEALLDCYFGDRIDFGSPALEQWRESREGDR
ncbi:MAG: hypothetical protein ACYTFG_16400 [Planctomycetota bacterium]|jgi:hypothetical protein